MELHEVEKYRPIPKGWLKLLLFPLLFLTSTTVLWAIVYYDLDKEKWVMRGGIVLGLVTILMLAEIVGVRHPIRWLRDYLLRNVTGYNVWFWRDEKQKIQVSFTRRGKKGDEDSSPLPLPVIKVPLGGWFNSSGGVYRRHFNEVGRAQGWKARFPSNPWRNALSPHVTLVDAEGHSITLGIGTALDFCEYYFTNDRTTEWILPVDVMLEDIKRLFRALDEARKRVEEIGSELSTVRDRLDCALRAMDEAIVGIKNTSRLGKSKEAKRIREGLIEDLLQIAPPGHPRRLVYELASSQAAAEAQAGG